ncbi:glutamate carboxypeptidase [Sporomusaceae bacterium BoRhaA]|uniref:M20 family metallopeptidase n=1 Tax=Pelorhabdus rhamnosifermentans TaxID=2772457 RepID=UPI0028B1CC1E|nr:M20 family metallopeptidase [Pelorhabdus rhamnosifermentans]MBU2702168.1 glutamate carboxypeptidase [Pelorhabdus rhamnosifermentans]
MEQQKKQLAFQFVEDHRQEMLSLWQELVNTESGSSEQAGIAMIAQKVKKVLADEGASIRLAEFEKAGNTLVGEIGVNRSKSGVIFMGHMDTVFSTGTVATRPFTIKDGKAYGPGVLDMKGGIVAFLYAIKALQAAGYNARPIKVILAGDEEVGHENSNVATCIVEEAKGYAAAFNCETGFADDGIVVGRKGSARFTLEVHGVAAHAGNDPENGRNAILEMAHKVIAIQGLNDNEQGTNINVGVIQGGTVPNAVPDYAKIIVDVRYTQPEILDKLAKQIHEIAAKVCVEGTTTVVTLKPGIQAMQTTEGVKQLFSLVEKTYAENGFGTPYPKKVGGGADSAYTVIAGVPTVCAMGVKGGRNHSPEEYAIVETLFERAKLLAACVLNLN